MEFFAYAEVPLSVIDLQRHIRIENLPEWCASINQVLSHSGEKGRIYCVWGEFAIHHETIRDGVRFTLPGCPNALQWSITVDDRSKTDTVTVHCTINQVEHDQDFVNSLQEFVEEWREGLYTGRKRIQAAINNKPKVSCAPWYG